MKYEIPAHMGYGPYFACNLRAIYIEITVFLGRQYGLKLHADCGHYIDQRAVVFIFVYYRGR